MLTIKSTEYAKFDPQEGLIFIWPNLSPVSVYPCVQGVNTKVTQSKCTKY